MFMTPHIDSHSTTDPKLEIQSAVFTGNRISRDGRNVRGIMHLRMCKKDDICWQRRLNHSGVGGGIAFRRVYPARAYATVVVLVRLDIKMCLIEKITCVLFLAYLIDLNIPRLKRWQLQARNVFK